MDISQSKIGPMGLQTSNAFPFLPSGRGAASFSIRFRGPGALAALLWVCVKDRKCVGGRSHTEHAAAPMICHRSPGPMFDFVVEAVVEGGLQ